MSDETNEQEYISFEDFIKEIRAMEIDELIAFEEGD